MKTIIVTGANGNLGMAVTNELLDKGYRVIATVANETGRKDFGANDHLDVQAVNLTNEEETSVFVAANIGRYEKIDAAILLVGGFANGHIDSTTGEEIRKQISLNFDTAYFVTRPLFQHMMDNNSGRIVFIGARPALIASQGKGLLAYGLSKSLLFKLAEYLNEESKGKNISVSVVVPSTIDTSINRKSMPEANPGNWVSPQQIAQTLEFLVSDKSSALRETIFKVYNNA